jgi:hypothetical protein
VSPSAARVVARPPRLAVGRSHTYVVGADIQLFDNQLVRESPLTILELGGAQIEAPPGRFFYLYPRGGVDTRDRLHLIWAEPAPATEAVQAKRWVFLPPASLWTAVYEPRTGWSKPTQLVFTTTGRDGIQWRPQQAADNLGGHGHQGIGLEEMRRAPNAPLQYASLDDEGWTLTTMPVPRLAPYVSFARDGRRMFVAFAQPDTSWVSSPLNPHRSDANSLFLMTSADGGTSWTSPKLISLSGQYPASEISALVVSGGPLHLVWKQQTSTGTVVRHVSSVDSGASWSPPSELRITGQFENQRAVVDRCGRIHLVYEDWSRGMDRIHIDYAMWDQEWSTPVHLFEALLAMAPDIRLAATGEPLATFVARDVGAGATFGTYFARMTP